MDFSVYHTEILSKLQPLGKPDQVNAVRNVTRTQLEVLAIKVPVLRGVVKAGFSFYNLPSDEVLAIWNDIWFSSPYYEVMSAALMYYDLLGKKISSELWPCLSTWHQRVENWAHCDSLASIYSYLLAKRPDEVYSQLQAWNVSDEEWLRRLSLVSLIHHAGKKTAFLPLDKILPLVTHIITDERHYVSRAVGWLLREAAKEYRSEIHAYIEEHMALMPGVAFSYAIEHYTPEDRKDIVARRKLLRTEKVSWRKMAQIVRIYPSGPLSGAISPPSSKYHTLRYILAAFLASDTSKVYYPAISDDTDVLLQACTQLGGIMSIESQPDGRRILSIQGTGGNLKTPQGGTLDVGNAGAVLRLLLGICAVSSEEITFTTPYPESLGRRPNADLLQALSQLGAIVESPTVEGTLPIKIRGSQLHGGKVQISGKKSSQYISSLLFLAPLLEDGLDIEIVDGLTSASFIDLTIHILQEAGISVLTQERYRRYIVPGKQHYQPQEYIIPGDYPSAAALLAAVAIAKGEITLTNLQADDASGQAVLQAFSEMGVQIARTGNTITARSYEPLRGINFDGNKTIDSVLVIVAAACFAHSPSRIYNVANLQLKESNRIADLAAELRKLGCQLSTSAYAFEISAIGTEGIHGGVQVDAHSDHRLIEALAAVGLGSKHPVTISNAQHVAKSYPHFFTDLTALGARVE